MQGMQRQVLPSRTQSLAFFLGIEWNSRKKEWKISNDFVLIVFLQNQFNFPFFYIGKHYNGPCENPV